MPNGVGDDPTGAASASDKLQVTLMHRLWLSAPAHLGGSLLVGLALVWIWATVHDANRAAYDAETEPAVVAALQHYQITRDANTGRLLLQENGREFVPESPPDPGALGLGRLTAVHGALVEFKNRIEAHNQSIAKRMDEFLTMWTEESGTWTLPLARAGIAAPPGATLWVEMLDPREMRKDSITAATGLLRAALGAKVWVDAEASFPVAPAREPVQANDERAAIQRLVIPAAAAVPANVTRAVGSLRWPQPASLSPDQASSLRRFFLARLQEHLDIVNGQSQTSFERLMRVVARLSNARGLLGCDLGAEAREHLAKCLKAWVAVDAKIDFGGTIDGALETLRLALKSDLQRVLYTVTLSESGFLWFYGGWRWWEIVWWTLFGVMTMGVFQICNHALMGKAHDGTRFDPRDGLRVLGRLFYAPLLAVVFFWLALATDFVDESSLFATNSFGGLGVAFLIGLAPNHLMRLLLRTLEVIVRGGEKSADKAGAPPPARVVQAMPQPAPGSIPSLADLRKRLGEIARAPLE